LDVQTKFILPIAIILLLNYKMDYLLEKGDDNKYTLTLSEHMTFLNKASVMNILRDIPKESKLIIDFSRTKVIDPDVLNVISEFKTRAETDKTEIVWRGSKGKNQENDLWSIDIE